MKNNLTITNQNSKLALAKSKRLLDIANKLLAKQESNLSINNFSYVPWIIAKGHSDQIKSVAITPDGKYIVSGGWDKTRGWDETIKIWDIKTGQCLNTLKGDSSSINSVTITPDGKTIVSGSGDGTIKYGISKMEKISII